MHAQSWPCVDFDDHSPLALERLRDVLGDHIDSGDIQADDACCFDRMPSDIRMDFVGHIGGCSAGAQVGVATDEDFLTDRRDRIGRHALGHQHPEGNSIDLDQAQGGRVPVAAARIFVDFIDQFLDSRLAITDDVGWFASGGSNEFSTDDEHSVVVARCVPFDDDRSAFLAGGIVSGNDLLLGLKVGRDASSVVAVLGFDDHGQTDVFGSFPSILGALDSSAFGRRYADGAEQGSGQLFVLGDRFGDGARRVGFGRADTSLMDSITELHQTSFVQATPGDALGLGRIDDRSGARSEANVIRELFELRSYFRHIVRGIVDGRLDQFKGSVQASQGELLFFEGDGDFIDPIGVGFPGATESDRSTGKRLQLECHVLENVGHVGPSSKPHEETPSLTDAAAMLDHRREPSHEPLVEPRDHLRRGVLHLFEVDPSFQNRVVRPNVWTSKLVHLKYLHSFLWSSFLLEK